jgi:hypothetical protein
MYYLSPRIIALMLTVLIPYQAVQSANQYSLFFDPPYKPKAKITIDPALLHASVSTETATKGFPHVTEAKIHFIAYIRTKINRAHAYHLATKNNIIPQNILDDYQKQANNHHAAQNALQTFITDLNHLPPKVQRYVSREIYFFLQKPHREILTATQDAQRDWELDECFLSKTPEFSGEGSLLQAFLEMNSFEYEGRRKLPFAIFPLLVHTHVHVVEPSHFKKPTPPPICIHRGLNAEKHQNNAQQDTPPVRIHRQRLHSS